MGATVTDANGQDTPVHMGSHGIGVSRLVEPLLRLIMMRKVLFGQKE